MFWKMGKLKVDILLSHQQFFYCYVTSVDGNLYCTMVYDSNELTQREELWECLLQLSSGIHEAWVITGDSNNVLRSEKRLGGQKVTLREIQGYEDGWRSVNWKK